MRRKQETLQEDNMTPIEQTILTVVCMIGAWFWGMRQGKEQGIIEGIGQAVDHLYEKGMIELDGENETQFEIGEDVNVRIRKEKD